MIRPAGDPSVAVLQDVIHQPRIRAWIRWHERQTAAEHWITGHPKTHDEESYEGCSSVQRSSISFSSFHPLREMRMRGRGLSSESVCDGTHVRRRKHGAWITCSR